MSLSLEAVLQSPSYLPLVSIRVAVNYRNEPGHVFKNMGRKSPHSLTNIRYVTDAVNTESGEVC